MKLPFDFILRYFELTETLPIEQDFGAIVKAEIFRISCLKPTVAGSVLEVF